MDEIRTSTVSRGGGYAERPSTPKHCQVLRFVGVNPKYQTHLRVTTTTFDWLVNNYKVIFNSATTFINDCGCIFNCIQKMWSLFMRSFYLRFCVFLHDWNPTILLGHVAQFTKLLNALYANRFFVPIYCLKQGKTVCNLDKLNFTIPSYP